MEQIDDPVDEPVNLDELIREFGSLLPRTPPPPSYSWHLPLDIPVCNGSSDQDLWTPGSGVSYDGVHPASFEYADLPRGYCDPAQTFAFLQPEVVGDRVEKSSWKFDPTAAPFEPSTAAAVTSVPDWGLDRAVDTAHWSPMTSGNSALSSGNRVYDYFQNGCVLAGTATECTSSAPGLATLPRNLAAAHRTQSDGPRDQLVPDAPLMRLGQSDKAVAPTHPVTAVSVSVCPLLRPSYSSVASQRVSPRLAAATSGQCCPSSTTAPQPLFSCEKVHQETLTTESLAQKRKKPKLKSDPSEPRPASWQASKPALSGSKYELDDFGELRLSSPPSHAKDGRILRSQSCNEGVSNGSHECRDSDDSSGSARSQSCHSVTGVDCTAQLFEKQGQHAHLLPLTSIVTKVRVPIDLEADAIHASKHLPSDQLGDKCEHSACQDKRDGSCSEPAAAPKKRPEQFGCSDRWFDPRRIFQNAPVAVPSVPPMTAANSGDQQLPNSPVQASRPGPILNNEMSRAQATNKNSGCGRSGMAGSERKAATYINNLHAGAQSLYQHAGVAAEPRRPKKQSNAEWANKSADSSVNVTPESRDGMGNVSTASCTAAESPLNLFVRNMVERLGAVSSVIWKMAKVAARGIISILILIIASILAFAGYLLLGAGKYAVSGFLKVYSFILVKMGREQEEDSAHAKLSIGLEDNIALPTTCEEAMKRLLSCKGKDAYSILGLRADASEEDIKRYYRKQAVLVHPDKNQQRGAEEAFKILGHAFELIGETEKRRLYDSKWHEERLTADMAQEFTDLLTKLQEKMEQAANTLKCSSCSGQHRRYLTDRPLYSARFCARCQLRHSVKEGDIWAETTYYGFKWHFYGCMDNGIYDITEWAKCQKNMVNRMQPNAHLVQFRVGFSNSGGHTSSREDQLGGLLSQLLKQAMPDGAGGGLGRHDSSPGPSDMNGDVQGSSGKGRLRKQRRKR